MAVLIVVGAISIVITFSLRNMHIATYNGKSAVFMHAPCAVPSADELLIVAEAANSLIRNGVDVPEWDRENIIIT